MPGSLILIQINICIFIKNKQTMKLAPILRNFCTSSRKLNFTSLKFSSLPIRPSINYQLQYRFSEPGKGPKYSSKEDAFQKKTQEMMNELPEEQDQSYYTKSQNKVTTYLMGISVVALFIAYGMMEVQGIRADKKMDKSITGLTKVTSSGKANIGGDWELIDTNGKKFGSKDLEGTYYLIYFGFCNCPDICPNSLIKLSKALAKIRKMPEYEYINLRTIFVSVDPERDTPQKIVKFLSFFDKSMIGVTGKSNDDPILKECMKKFKIYASKIEFEDEDTVIKGRKAYTIDHTILTYLMSDSNEYLAHLGANLGEHQLAKIILDKILANEQEKMRFLADG